MDVMPAILARRSIRKYTETPVDEDVIHELLAAGMAAPSGHNAQPWHFVVVTERGQLDALAEGHVYGKMLRQAPLAIVVCGEPRLSEAFWVQDCSAATQNILLAAHAHGLGAVWVGVYPQEALVSLVRRVTGLPEEIMPLNIVPIGHPAEEKEPAGRFDPARIHREHW